MKSPYMMTPTLRLNLLTSTVRVASLLLAAIGLLFSFSMAAQAATFHVTATADNGDNNNPTPGSLRKAIIDANNNPGADVIDFQILPAGGVQTISPPSPLPVINDSVTIDGYTQPGASKNTLANGNDAVLMIELDGTNAGSGFNGIGLDLVKGSTTIRGLVINRFSYQGIAIYGFLGGSIGNTIEGCFIGTDPTGTIALPNLVTGIYINTSSDNLIGGTAPEARNVISANGDSKGNGQGILLAGGNGLPVSTTIIQGNYIGTNAAGTAAVGKQGTGMSLSGTKDTTVGGSGAGARNIISGNARGIDTTETDHSLIQGNYIGTDFSGTVAIGNKYAGIRLFNSPNNTIGGSAAGARNIISATVSGPGISFQTKGSTGNVVQGNYIGVDVSGSIAFANDNGIAVEYSGLGGPSNTKIGGAGAGEGNVISGNKYFGISLSNGANGNTIQGNLIGTNADGTVKVANGDPANTNGGGISLFMGSGDLIGGTVTGARNIISGNYGYGVRIAGVSTSELVQGNFIGVDVNGAALGNKGAGVYITEGQNNGIGGATTGAGNIIAFNGMGGVIIHQTTDVGNAISGNAIYSNVANLGVGLGIDLGFNGVTKNDAGDSDSGPNNLQNFPSLTSATVNGGNTIIQGTLNSTANTQFRVEFFANLVVDPSLNGEGQFFLGATNVATDATGNAAINAVLPGLPAGQFISATATDPSGNTSEFSTCVLVDQPISTQLQFNSATYSVNEGAGIATISVARTGGITGAVSVQYSTSDGSATAGQDYTATSGTLNWADGDFSVKSFTIAITDDSLNEANETVNVVLSNPGGGATLGNQSSAVVTIVDNDQASSLSINDVAQKEGDSGTTNFSFSVTLSPGSAQTVTVDYAAVSDTAVLGTDFQPSSGTLTFGPGETHKSITVLVNGDTTQEPDRTFFVNLSQPNGGGVTISKAQGTGTIINDDGVQPATVQFDQPSYSVQEDLGALTIKVTRSGDTSSTVSVDYATNDGTATQKADFEYAAGTLTFAPGETSKTLSVLINDDAHIEGDEIFQVVLANSTGASLGQASVSTVTIVDDVPESPNSPLDDAQSFVHTHYHDFLNREPDAAGLQFWTKEIESCGADVQCLEVKRMNVSAAFFLSIEFQQTGFLLHLLQRESFASMPKYASFMRDLQEVSRDVIVNTPGWEQKLKDNQQQFAEKWVNRPEFKAVFDGMSNADYVNALYANVGIVAQQAEKQALVAKIDGASETRAAVLLDVAANSTFRQQECSSAHVLMQYFGYLRRDPDAAPDSDLNGYSFWLNKLNSFGGNFQQAEMVKAFLNSFEYRQRFDQ